MPRAEEKLKVKKDGIVPFVSKRGVKNTTRALGHAISNVRNSVRPSEALAIDVRQADLEITREDQSLKAIKSLRDLREEDDREDPKCPYVQCAEGSLATVGSKAMLSEIASVGGFHLVDFDAKVEDEDIDPEIEGDGQELGLKGLIFPALIEQAEQRQTAMERALTQADQA
jgi:hypothetical protein